ncbi:CCDC90 family protein [Acidobacteria bacterium AH-259-L09]|nr:CCDC90 family protein [Acidobacteria bacterium AH-259-L09]
MDTLKAYEKLRTKFDEDTAKLVVDTLAELVSPPLATLATKEDLAQFEQRLELRMDTRLAELRAELQTEIQAAKGELRTEIQAAKVETIRWVLGAALGQVIAVVALVGAVLALAR